FRGLLKNRCGQFGCAFRIRQAQFSPVADGFGHAAVACDKTGLVQWIRCQASREETNEGRVRSGEKAPHGPLSTCPERSDSPNDSRRLATIGNARATGRPPQRQRSRAVFAVPGLAWWLCWRA